jgi:hypothetical protein
VGYCFFEGGVPVWLCGEGEREGVVCWVAEFGCGLLAGEGEFVKVGKWRSHGEVLRQ